MSLINGSIPSLINGVSQQPPSSRLTSQCEWQENATSSITDGVGKRLPTQHIGKLTGFTDVLWPYVHFINRDENEKYVAMFQGDRVKVFDLRTGVEYPIVSTLYELGYLTCDRASRDIQCLTIADTTFVLNRSVPVTMNGETTPPRSFESIVWVRAGNYDTTYTLTIDGVEFKYTTPHDKPGDIATDNIAHVLFKQIRASLPEPWKARWRAGDNVLWIYRHDGKSFSIEASDSNANKNITTFTNEVQKFSDLPALCANGYIVKVRGDFSSDADDYWVRFKTEAGQEFGRGLWEETAKPGVESQIEPSSMPHVLLREQDAEGNIVFRFKKAGWGQMLVGDDETNPRPSFVGQKISKLFLHRNRLGVLAGSDIILSRSGSFFDFWRGTVQQVLDDDAIDVSSSSPRVSTLRHAVPFAEELLLFGENTQLMLRGGDALTTRTVSIPHVTDFDADEFCTPVSSGNVVYFPFLNGEYSGVREFYVDSQNNQKDSQDITKHVPRFIKGRAVRMSVSTTDNILVVQPEKIRDTLAVYQWHWNGQDKVQSAWHRWSFDGGTILAAEFVGPDLYVVIKRQCGQYLERIDVSSRADENANYVTHLDRRITDLETSVVYNGVKDETNFILPYNPEHLPMLVSRTDPVDTSWKPAEVYPVRMEPIMPIPPIIIPVDPTDPTDPTDPPPLPVVTVIATDPQASEFPNDVGVFTLSRTGSAAAALTVSIAYSGTATPTTDYTTTNATTVTFPIGVVSVAVTITPVNDAAAEGTETVILTVLPSTGGTYTLGNPFAATVFILDDETGGGVPCTNTDLTKFSMNFSGVNCSHSGNRSIDGAPWVSSGTLGSYCDPTMAASRSVGMDLVFGGTSHETQTIIAISGGPPQLIAAQASSSGINTVWFRGDVPSDWATRTTPFSVTNLNTTSGNDGPIGTGGTCLINPCGCVTGSALTPPSTPTTLVATGGVNQIVLSWTDTSTTETGFAVERSDDGSTGWFEIGRTLANIATFTNTTLPGGTRYYYRVRAFNASGYSAYSNVSNATTTGSTTTPVLDIQLWNTGEERVQSGCSFADVHWTFNGTSAKLAYPSDAAAWIENDADASWISYNETTQDINEPTTINRNVATMIDIGGDVDLTTLVISGSLAVDNTVEDIVVNGTSTGVHVTSINAWLDFTAFTLPTSLFTHGINTVIFKVRNIGALGTNNPTGLIVKWDRPWLPPVAARESETPVTMARENTFTPPTLRREDSTADFCSYPMQLITKGDYRGKAFYIGHPYTTTYEFSTVHLRQNTPTGGIAAVLSGRLQLRTMSVALSNTGYFRAEVTPILRQTNKYHYDARTVSVPDTRIGVVPLGTGTQRFTVASKNDQASIKLINDSFLPSWFIAAEYEGVYMNRARRL
jgi:hypothetical protein